MPMRVPLLCFTLFKACYWIGDRPLTVWCVQLWGNVKPVNIGQVKGQPCFQLPVRVEDAMYLSDESISMGSVYKNNGCNCNQPFKLWPEVCKPSLMLSWKGVVLYLLNS